MLSEQVDALLCCYRQNTTRHDFLLREIERIERELERKLERMADDSVSVSPSLTGMPHGGTLSDPTGKLGVKLASGFKTEEVCMLEDELSARKKELEEKKFSVSVTETLLKGLREKELFIVEKKMIDGYSWEEVRFSFNRTFSVTYSVPGLKHIKRTAMQKLYEAAR